MTEPKQMTEGQMSLLTRLIFRFGFAMMAGIAVLFFPAGSLGYWEGWAFLSILAGWGSFLTIYLYRHDRQLLRRRMETKEQENTQKLFRMLFMPLWIAGLLLCGFDHRFGWSQTSVGRVPLWLTWTAQALVALAYYLVFRVMKENSFASSVIKVESGQTVISTGPYRLVRHPMYSAISLMMLATPLALGSYVALPLFALMIPLLVLRLLNEEKVLRQNLPGYTEYCTRTRFRLLPFVL